MSDLHVVCPAPASACIECRRGNVTVGKALLVQRMMAETLAIYTAHGELLGVAYLYQERRKRTLFALAIRSVAARHMRSLIRFAHLTLRNFMDTGRLVYAQVHPLNSSGQRMAKMTGFRQSGFNEHVWIFDG